MVQLLAPDGTRTPHDELDPVLAHLSAEDLRGFYRDMVMIRAADLGIALSERRPTMAR